MSDMPESHTALQGANDLAEIHADLYPVKARLAAECHTRIQQYELLVQTGVMVLIHAAIRTGQSLAPYAAALGWKTDKLQYILSMSAVSTQYCQTARQTYAANAYIEKIGQFGDRLKYTDGLAEDEKRLMATVVKVVKDASTANNELAEYERSSGQDRAPIVVNNVVKLNGGNEIPSVPSEIEDIADAIIVDI